MKKLSLLIVLIVALSLTAFAETIVEPTITGSATATIGFSLDNNSFGIKNESSSSISIILVDKASDSKGGEGVYGEIQLNDFEILMNTDPPSEYDLWARNEDGDELDVTTNITGDDTKDFQGVRVPVTVTAPSIVAKLVLSPNLYVQIDSEPGLVVADKVAEIVDDSASSLDLGVDETDDANDIVVGGLTIGVAAGPATIAAKVATQDNYEGATDVSNAGLVVGADISVAAGPATIDANFGTGINYSTAVVPSRTGFGAKVTMATGPITVTGAYDGEMIGNAAMAMEAGGGLSFAIGDGTSISADAAYLAPAIGSAVVDAKVAFAETAGSGMVAPLGLNLSATLTDLTGTLGWDADVDFTFDATDTLTLKGDFGYGNNEVMNAMAGVDLKMLANTVITLMFDADDLNSKEADSDHDKGRITCAIAISY